MYKNFQLENREALNKLEEILKDENISDVDRQKAVMLIEMIKQHSSEFNSLSDDLKGLGINFANEYFNLIKNQIGK